MKGWADARRAVEQYVIEKVPTTSGITTVPVYLENQERPKRSGNPPGEWIGLSMSEQASAYTTVGPSPRLQVSGLIVAQVFTPLGGPRLARRSAEVVEALAGLFISEGIRAATSGRLSFLRPPYQQPVGASDGWWQDNLLVPYVRSLQVTLASAWTAAP